VFISEVYNGPFKGYLEFLPTVLFSLSLPAITSLLNDMATRLTEYENYRTQDQFELAQTQKTFVMNFITSFLPTLLTAFVYVPFGAKIVPYLDIFSVTGLGPSDEFHVNSTRLQQEVIYLSVTGQVFNFGEEFVLPYVKRVLWQKWRDYRQKQAEHRRDRRHSVATDLLLVDPPDEAALMHRIRNEADADEYKVQDDIMEMCVQFGYLALFGIAWPLVPLGFLLNNWLELRGDFFKLSLECQRPPPVRTDSIGPSLQGLEFLTWLGSLSTAAIAHLYRGSMQDISLSSLLLTILAMRFAVRTAMQKLGSDSVRLNEACRYAVRKGYLDALSKGVAGDSPGKRQRVRFNQRVDVYSSATENGPETNCLDDAVPNAQLRECGSGVLRAPQPEGRFWSGHKRATETADAGVKLIRALSTRKSGDLRGRKNGKVA
jgi:anoctamin-10